MQVGDDGLRAGGGELAAPDGHGGVQRLAGFVLAVEDGAQEQGVGFVGLFQPWGAQVGGFDGTERHAAGAVGVVAALSLIHISFAS